MNTALLLIRTPFQAYLVSQILAQEEIVKYDLVYFTSNNSPEDIYYYTNLSRRAIRKQYIFVRPKNPDILWHVFTLWKGKRWLISQMRQLTILGSIDSLAIRVVASRQLGNIITLDDGSANVSQVSYYKSAYNSDWRNTLYSRITLSMTMHEVCQQSEAHYTVFPGLDNVVQSHKLKYLSKWSPCPTSSLFTNQDPLIFFIGAPFESYLEHDQILLLKSFLETNKVDFYVPHPQETSPLVSGASRLEKNGLIAEEAIINKAKGRPIVLISHFSTVLFTLSSIAYQRVMLLFRNDPNSDYYLHDIKKLGGSPVRIIEL